MIRALLPAITVALSVPLAPTVFAQSHDGRAVTTSSCTPEHAAMGHCTLPAPKPAAPADPDCPPEHAEMGHCTPRAAPPPATAKPVAPVAVPADYADRVWGAEAMAPARAAMHREHGGGSFSKVMIDRAEAVFRRGREGYGWEADAWFGGDIDRLVVTTEGEGDFGGTLESAEVAAFYSRAIGPYFNLQAGLRHDIRPDPSRTHLAIGIEGLAPYWFEVDAHLYLSSKGELRAAASAEYDQRLTQRLILQPRIELDFSAQHIPALGIGAGLTSAEIGLRLRYEFVREFAPYIGIVHERSFGRTAGFARAAGDRVSSTGMVVGIRAWF